MNRIAIFISFAMTAWIIFPMQTIQAQIVNTDTLVYPLATTGQSFENYLVSLAWENNPEYKIFASKINIAQNEVAIAKRAWADDWTITLNLNENNLNANNEGVQDVQLTQATQDILEAQQLGELIQVVETSGQSISVNNFPRYNFGLTLNLGSLLTRGKEVNIAEQNMFIEEFSKDQGKLDIRADVYQAYAEYNQSIKSLKIVAKQEQTAADIFDLMKTRFKSGSIAFDDYNQSASQYNDALGSLNTAEEKVILAKFAVERLIVIPLKLAQYHYDQNNGQ